MSSPDDGRGPTADRLRLTLRRASRLVPAVAFLLAVPGCGGDGLPAPGEPGGEESGPELSRSYRMGWFVTSPRPDTETLLATLDSAASVSEIALVQEPPPWPRLLAGETVEELVAEKEELAGFLRSRGLEVAFLVDPLDGLDRTSETPELAAAGRSLLEPEIRELHEAWVLEVARRVRPTWMGLASEINTLGQHGDPILYDLLVEMVGDLAPRIREVAPGTEVTVSFQVEDAHGLFIPEDGPGFGLVADFEEAIDFLGLSSYPVFVFERPGDVPDDHLSAFATVTDLPLGLVEGGWSSESVAGLDSDPEEQAEFLERYAALLDGVSARFFVLLTFPDLDVDSFGLPPERLEAFRPFAFMGVVDVDLNPKPALAAWESIRARPLAE